MGKDAKGKQPAGKGKGKQPASGSDEGASKGGKGDKLSTCAFVKARHVLSEKQGKINEVYQKLQEGWLDNGDKVRPAEFGKRFFVGYGLELSRLVPLIIFHLKKKYLCKTDAEVKEAWCPGDFGYATRVPNDLLILTLVLCYSIIAPLTLLFGVFYFGIGWLILRNQLREDLASFAFKIPCCVTSLPSYHGWLFWYTKEFIYTPILIPLPIVTLIFAFVCQKKFYRFFQCTALEVASHELKETTNMEYV